MKIHSYMSPKCAVKASSKGGRGVFSKGKIKKGDVVAVWGGIVYSTHEVKKLSRRYSFFSTHTVSVCDGFYLGPINRKTHYDDSELFNHSCDPNIGVKGQIVIVARKDIKKGEELCFDYDTTETSNEGWFYCSCSAKNCRKKIDGSSWKNPIFIKKNREYISWYILEKAAKWAA